MKKVFLLLFLALVASISFAETPFKDCEHSCRKIEKGCINECTCRAKDRPMCANQCITSTTRCVTLCKAEHLDASDNLPTTALPNDGSDLQCKLAPEVYQYW